MAQDAVARLFGEGDLGDKVRLDPAGAATDWPGHILEGRSADLASPELLPERAQDGVIITGADAAFVDQTVLAEFADEEGCEAAPLFVGWPIAADDELRSPETFALDPGRRASRHIGTRPVLGHQAFDAEPAGFGENLVALPFDMIAVSQGRFRLTEQFLQPAF